MAPSRPLGTKGMCGATVKESEACGRLLESIFSPNKREKPVPAVQAEPRVTTTTLTFQDLLFRLQAFWAERGCVIQQSYDVEVGAGTMCPETFLRVLGP